MTTLIILLAASTMGAVSIQPQHRGLENRHVFSPRMDYEEWTPLGQGDPLKNDPTYDYVPPVLDRVHYWMDPSKRTPDPPLPNAGVMVLGSRTDVPTSTASATSRFATASLIDPFLKFMETSKASLGLSTHVTNYFRPTPNPPQHIQHSPNHVFYGPPPPPSQEYLQGSTLQRPPFTMLMPPPLLSSTEAPLTSFGTTTTTQVITDKDETLTATTETATTLLPSTPTATSTTNLANLENYYKPVAINMPESISNETNEEFLTSKLPKFEKDEVLPFVSLFNENNNIQYQDHKLPSMVMVPPPEKYHFFEFRPTTVRTTTSRTLTTDPMFRHYKQPKEPMRGPFYLIIQGHSKVKTYGASKNKVKAVSSNEINYEEGRRMRDENELESQSHESDRRERKLRFKDTIDEDSAAIIQGHPTIELTASFNAKGQAGSAGFRVGGKGSTLESLDGAQMKKKLLVKEKTRRRRSPGRSLLSTVPNEGKKEKPNLDKDQLGIESLIALSDDYNSEDIINALLKQEGQQGSGFGGLVSSLLAGRSADQKNEEM